MPGTTPDFRRDVTKIGAIFSEVQRDVVEMRQILNSREGEGSQNRVVSDNEHSSTINGQTVTTT
jgi:hypothetical protein